MKKVTDEIKGFLIYISIVAIAALTVFINWLKVGKDTIDERVGYESGRNERD